jgi:hypothetical protein
MKTYLQIPEDRTVKVAGDRATHFKVSVDYDKGGVNYFTYKTSPRGYYLYVTPVVREDGFERSVLLGESAGFKVLLKEVSRMNRKSLQLAETLVEGYLPQLLPLLLDANREGILALTAKMKEAL